MWCITLLPTSTMSVIASGVMSASSGRLGGQVVQGIDDRRRAASPARLRRSGRSRRPGSSGLRRRRPAGSSGWRWPAPRPCAGRTGAWRRSSCRCRPPGRRPLRVARLHAHGLAALPDGDRDLPVALADDRLQLAEQDRVEPHVLQPETRRPARPRCGPSRPAGAPASAARSRRSRAGSRDRRRWRARLRPCARPACAPGSPRARRSSGRPAPRRRRPGGGPAAGDASPSSCASRPSGVVRWSAAEVIPCFGNVPSSTLTWHLPHVWRPLQMASISTPSERAASSRFVPAGTSPCRPEGWKTTRYV